MRKQLIQHTAHEVAAQTRIIEDTIETALIQLAELHARLVRVSNVAGISYSTLQESFEHVAATTNDMVRVRGSMAQCHIAFAEAKEHIPGLRSVAWGDCPKVAVAPHAPTALRAVA